MREVGQYHGHGATQRIRSDGHDVWNVYDGDMRVGQAALFRRSGCKFLL